MIQFFGKIPSEPKWEEIKEADAALSNDGDSMDGLLGNVVGHEGKSMWSPRHYTARNILLLLLGLNVVWSLTNLTTLYLQHHPPQLNYNMRKVSTPSFLFDKVDLGPITKRMRGELHDNVSIYRKPPSLEVDKAWDRISMKGFEVINATAAQLREAGEDPGASVKWEPDIDSFPVEVEVAHKIHCLDRARKAIWGDHYYGEHSIQADERALARGDYTDDDSDLYNLTDSSPTLKGERRMQRIHIMHCIDMIRQDLTCNSDVGIIPIKWVHGHGFGRNELQHIDKFSTLKQCRNYEALLDWIHENQGPGQIYRDGGIKYIPGTRISETNDSYLP